MGTPKVRPAEPVEISVAEKLLAYSRAKTCALFRSAGNRVAALEQLRQWLTPMVQWLDKPVDNSLWRKSVTWTNLRKNERLMVLHPFPWEQGYHRLLCITREGKWVILLINELENTGSVVTTTSHKILKEVWTWRWKFLNHPVVLMVKGDVESIPEVEDIAAHAAFLEFVESILKEVKDELRAREERLQVLRANLDVVGDFTEALDPFSYWDEGGLRLQEYSVFWSQPGNTSRCSPDYLVSGPVAQDVAARNGKNRSPRPEGSYVVFTGSRRLPKARAFLSVVRGLLEEIGQDKRLRLIPEEKETLAAVARKVSNFPA